MLSNSLTKYNLNFLFITRLNLAVIHDMRPVFEKTCATTQKT